MDFNSELLNRFFKGNYSRKDYFEVKRIFSDPGQKSELKQHLRIHWSDFFTQEIPGRDINHLLDKIHHKIRLEENSRRKIKFLTVFQKVAAILIVPLLLASLSIIYFQANMGAGEGRYKSAYAEIQCPLGVRTKFELPDGSTGFLNSGSRLKYPVAFADIRNVTVSGEAYFNIANDESHPFIVQTPNLNIKVLGTQFNVIAYEDDLNEEVILNEGSVDISSLEGKRVGAIRPDQKFVLNTQKRAYSINEVEASQYIGWTEGKLIFRNENIQQVADRLGRWYNAEIRIESPELLNYAFRATFIDESLEEVLKLLALTAPLAYEEKPRVISNDTFQKRIVIVKLDQERLNAFK